MDSARRHNLNIHQVIFQSNSTSNPSGFIQCKSYENNLDLHMRISLAVSLVTKQNTKFCLTMQVCNQKTQSIIYIHQAVIVVALKVSAQYSQLMKK